MIRRLERDGDAKGILPFEKVSYEDDSIHRLLLNNEKTAYKKVFSYSKKMASITTVCYRNVCYQPEPSLTFSINLGANAWDRITTALVNCKKNTNAIIFICCPWTVRIKQ